jgi:hypothetical protein
MSRQLNRALACSNTVKECILQGVKNPRPKDGAFRKHPLRVHKGSGFDISNSKHEIRNSKRFDRLTALSKVEGQYRMTKIQMRQLM